VGLREELLAQGCVEKVRKGRGSTIYYECREKGIVAKACTRCGELKKLVDFAILKAGLGGSESRCKECKRTYYQENKEQCIERSRAWTAANKDKVAKYTRTHRKENPESRKMIYRRYRERHADRLRESARNWRRKNPDKVRLRNNLRRAQRNSLPNTLTKDQQDRLFLKFNNTCALSGHEDNIQLDHVIPLSTGFGGTTYENTIPLRGDLNSSKQDSNLFKWFYANKDRFNLEQHRFDYLVEHLAEVNGMTIAEYADYYNSCFKEAE